MHSYPTYREDDTLADHEWRVHTNPDNTVTLVTGPGVLLRDGAQMLTDLLNDHFRSCRVCIAVALDSLGLPSGPDQAEALARLLAEAAEHRRMNAAAEVAGPSSHVTAPAPTKPVPTRSPSSRRAALQRSTATTSCGRDRQGLVPATTRQTATCASSPDSPVRPRETTHRAEPRREPKEFVVE